MRPVTKNRQRQAAVLGQAGMIVILVLLWIGLFPSPPARGEDVKAAIKIGVLANKGRDECLKKWVPTADYLTGKIPGHVFTIVPLDFKEVVPAVAEEQVDFVLVNPANYVELEYLHSISCIATLKNLLGDKVSTVFAGAIFTSSKRGDLATLQNLKGATFMAVDKKSFGGWDVSWFELLEQGIDPYRDFKEVRFGGTHDAVVYAVREGLVDAGCVRSDTLERMALDGKIAISDFKVFPHAVVGKDYFPFLHSTDHYPEWSFAKLEEVPAALSEQVAMALLSMKRDDPAARSANAAGWTIPLNYQPVHECLQRLKISPYEHFGETTFPEAVRQHLFETGVASLLLLMLLFSGIRARRLNSSLQMAKAEVDTKLEEQKKAQRKLKESEERIKIILASMQTGIIIIDPETHTIVYVNSLVVNMIGLPRERIVGRRCFGLICPKKEGECPVTDLHEVVKNAKKVLLTATGEELPVLKTVSFIRIGGKEFILDSFQDISKLQKAEEELARRSASLAIRVKMLHCLNEISRVMETREYNMGEMLTAIIRRIPLAWQHPERICARILLEGRAYVSENFNKSSWQLTSTIKLASGEDGAVEVYYLPAQIDCPDDPFLAEERELLDTIANQISYNIERKKAQEGRKFFRHLVDQATDGFFVVDPMTSRILEVNARACRLLGYEREEIVRMRLAQITTLTPDDRLFSESNSDDLSEAMVLESAFRRKDGSTFPVEAHLKIISQENRNYLVVLAHDITFRKAAEKEKKAMEAQLLQSEKMAAVGQLSAGVAHEINNPTGFVSSNLSTLENYIRDVKQLTAEYQKLSADLTEQLDASEYPVIVAQLADLHDLEKKIDIDYVLKDIDDLVSESREGTERIKKIVTDLKGFSHPGEDRQQMADINAGIESTLNVVWNEIKYKAQVTKQLGNIPLVRCYPQQINQVLMNILVNAAQAIPEKGEIAIRTCLENDMVKITISDTGTGIKPENLQRIFEPFFTTKEVGKGTGLGLNVAYNIIKKHKGTIEAQSTVGAGTTFTITLPQDADVASDTPA